MHGCSPHAYGIQPDSTSQAAPPRSATFPSSQTAATQSMPRGGCPVSYLPRPPRLKSGKAQPMHWHTAPKRLAQSSATSVLHAVRNPTHETARGPLRAEPRTLAPCHLPCIPARGAHFAVCAGRRPLAQTSALPPCDWFAFVQHSPVYVPIACRARPLHAHCPPVLQPRQAAMRLQQAPVPQVANECPVILLM